MFIHAGKNLRNNEMIIQTSNNGFYFTMSDINGQMISEGQYSFKSGLWIYTNDHYKNVSSY